MLRAPLGSLFLQVLYRTLITWRNIALCSSVLSRGIKLRRRPRICASNLTLTALFRWLPQRGRGERKPFSYYKITPARQKNIKRQRLQNYYIDLGCSLIAKHPKVVLLCGLWLIHCQGICSYGHVLDARWARCCLVERQGSRRQHCRPPSNTTEQGCRTDKRDLQKGLFPPGFSSRAWQRLEPVSLILPPGQSLASSPDGGEQGGEQGD